MLCSVNRNRGDPITGPSRAGARRRGASLPDDCFQMIEVTSEGGAAGRGRPPRRLRTPPAERFADGDDPRPPRFRKVAPKFAAGLLHGSAHPVKGKGGPP